jgi:hypothetical protein
LGAIDSQDAHRGLNLDNRAHARVWKATREVHRASELGLQEDDVHGNPCLAVGTAPEGPTRLPYQFHSCD